MNYQDVRFGVIGCGLMGREFASAAARWAHLSGVDARPVILAACDLDPRATEWFDRHVPSIAYTTDDYTRLLSDDRLDAIYCALPHNLHARVYRDVVVAGKHLLGEKPFGIDRPANAEINSALSAAADVFVRCSSEFPFYPGAYRIAQWALEERYGRIIEVDAGFWHSSDLNPDKPINWKRMVDVNGAYGCMGDLGLHVLHLPLRFGWRPSNVRALLSNIITQRPSADGGMVACDTWDNAILSTEVEAAGYRFPMTLSMKRIAPGHANTWFIRIYGTDLSAEFSTRNPKELRFMPYAPGGEQAWQVMDVPHKSAYPSITGGIFEFGFSDAILQMWAAYCDEMMHGRDMRQPLLCATPEEAAQTHALFTAAQESQRDSRVIELKWANLAEAGQP